MEYICNDDYLDDEDRDIMYSRRQDSSDSEDESAFVLSKLLKKSKKNEESDDDFEKEMQDELESTMLDIRDSFTKSSDATTSANSKKKPEYYNNIYFDTDDESSDEDSGKSTKEKEKKDKIKEPSEKKKIISDDELLYDPLMDDLDEVWVEKNRKKKMFGISKSAPNSESQKLPDSDAVLNCPACFSTLSFDCQRHEVYKDQYRAMFVSNCYIDFKEKLLCPVKADKKEKFRKRKRDSDAPEGDGDASKSDDFHPVRCTECNTKVAVYDTDEVYHFFNVLTSF